MAVENSPIGGLAEHEEVRRRALLRLGVAAVVTTAALAGLWWLDQGAGKKPEKPIPAALPAPIVAAPPQESAPPQAAPGEAAAEPPPSAPIPEPTDKAAATAPATAAKAAEPPPPPPKVSNVAKTLSVPAAAPRATPSQPPATQAAAPQAAAAGERFVVQLGVFSNPERARELVHKLNRQGIRAHMETRVHLGPFASREEAEKAQATMVKLGMQALVTPAVATK